jgi:hypothetical protein
MRLLVRSIVIAGGILVLAGSQNASAQIVYPVEFTTTFPFTVGNATVPAGSYTIRPDENEASVLELTGAGASVFFETEVAQPRKDRSKDELVFQRYDGGYVLKSIWVAGSDIGYVTVPAKGERRVSKRGPSQSEEHVAARKTANTDKR